MENIRKTIEENKIVSIVKSDSSNVEKSEKTKNAILANCSLTTKVQ